MGDQGLLKALTDSGLEPIPDSGPEQTRRFIQEEVARWTPIVKAAGLKLEKPVGGRAIVHDDHSPTLRIDRSRHAFLRHPPQCRAVDLVGRGERQVVDEEDEARVLIGRRVGKREPLHRVLARPAAGFQDHEGDRLRP